VDIAQTFANLQGHTEIAKYRSWEINSQTGGQSDRQTERQKERFTDRQIDR